MKINLIIRNIHCNKINTNLSNRTLISTTLRQISAKVTLFFSTIYWDAKGKCYLKLACKAYSVVELVLKCSGLIEYK